MKREHKNWTQFYDYMRKTCKIGKLNDENMKNEEMSGKHEKL